MPRSTVFKNNKTQAIRVPKAVALPDHIKQVEVTRHGDGLLIMPVKKSVWDKFFSTPGVDADFMSDRKQDLPQQRKFE